MIIVPKFDLEKLVNDLAAVNDGKDIELRYVVKAKPRATLGAVSLTTLEAATGVTTTQWVSGQTPEELLTNVKTRLQQLFFQLTTGTAKMNGKRARDRVRLAARLFREIFPDESVRMSAFSDGDFNFCTQIAREEVKKVEEALAAKGWLRDKETWIQKPKDMKNPENQDRASFFVRIAPVPTMWKIVDQNGRDPFEFWFDEMSK